MSLFCKNIFATAKNTFALYVLLIFISSCNKSDFNFDKLAANQWDATFAVPLINSTINLNDINLPANCYLKVEADNSQSIVYTGNFATVKSTDFITQLNSIPVNTIYNLNVTDLAAFNTISIGSSYQTTSSQIINLSAQTTNGAVMDLDSVILKSGILNLQIQNTFSHKATVVIAIPAIKKSGISISNTINLNANATTQLNIDLSNAKIDLTKNGTTENKIEIIYTTTITKENNNSTGNIVYSGAVNNATYKILFGDVHQQTMMNKGFDSINIPIFKSIKKTEGIILNNANIQLNFNNTFGIPFSTSFISIKGFNPQQGNFYLNTSNINPTNFIVNAALQGQTSTASLTLNQTNPIASGSNLSLNGFLNNMPYNIVPKANTQTNPSGVILPLYKNFIADTSSASVSGIVTIPLDGKIQGFNIKDTFNFSFGSVNNVESFTIRTLINNGFPVSLASKLIFTDEFYNIVYTLDGASNPIINSGTIDATTSKVITPTTTTSEFLIGGTTVPNLYKVKKVVMQLNIASVANGQQNVKIYADNNLNFIMGIKAKLKL
ncbi:MAG: hypothetical protein JSR09_01780 [Bacteroidetes bacterium]|nr:hypothetical protein [Bacteroidota bacterium]MBS1648411.1 hypothetical protein [Bacteroidota bacterium]